MWLLSIQSMLLGQNLELFQNKKHQRWSATLTWDVWRLYSEYVLICTFQPLAVEVNYSVFRAKKSVVIVQKMFFEHDEQVTYCWWRSVYAWDEYRHGRSNSGQPRRARKSLIQYGSLPMKSMNICFPARCENQRAKLWSRDSMFTQRSARKPLQLAHGRIQLGTRSAIHWNCLRGCGINVPCSMMIHVSCFVNTNIMPSIKHPLSKENSKAIIKLFQVGSDTHRPGEGWWRWLQSMFQSSAEVMEVSQVMRGLPKHPNFYCGCSINHPANLGMPHLEPSAMPIGHETPGGWWKQRGNLDWTSNSILSGHFLK